MISFVRKASEEAVLREDWHENEDGSRLLLLKYPLLERTGNRGTLFYDEARRRQCGHFFHHEFKLYQRR